MLDCQSETHKKQYATWHHIMLHESVVRITPLPLGMHLLSMFHGREHDFMYSGTSL